jgi:capsular exopolysaccharide synthesis family protein
MENQRVILVSSAAAGEGKTTLATHLAMSFARNGRQTVLVDFDLRRPALDGVFGLPLTPGVSEMLRGESDPDQLAQPTETENLSVLTAGAWDRRALASLANGSASALLKDLREKYEFVVIDASPILPVADTRFVSQHVDEVVLAVFRDVSQSPKVEAACEILKAFGVANPQAVVTGSSETVRDRDLGYETSVPA